MTLPAPSRSRALENMAPEAPRTSGASNANLLTINEAGLPLFADRKKEQQEVRTSEILRYHTYLTIVLLSRLLG